MNHDLLQKTVSASFSGEMIFPEILALLARDGIEWYSANLLIGATTHYASDGSWHSTRWADWKTPAIAQDFDGTQVLAAIRASQKGEHRYPEFLQKIAAAGVVYYTVHLQGRKAIYFGRHGDSYTEPFPQI